MKNVPGLRFLLALVLMLTAGACAGTRGGQGSEVGDMRGVNIEVENTGTPSSDITVYLIASSGGRYLVGSVPPNRTATLVYRGNTLGGQYRLLARPTGGREIVSTPFSLTGSGGVRWNLQSNIAIPID